MEFEWDRAKSRANVAKHGIDFETAKRIFGGPVLMRPDRRRDYGEARYISVGQVEAAVVVVVHTWHDGRVRLISARSASRKERQIWHERRQAIPDPG